MNLVGLTPPGAGAPSGRPEGKTTALTYDAATGDLLSSDDPLGHVTTFDYDDLGRVERIVVSVAIGRTESFGTVRAAIRAASPTGVDVPVRSQGAPPCGVDRTSARRHRPGDCRVRPQPTGGASAACSRSWYRIRLRFISAQTIGAASRPSGPCGVTS